MKREAKKDADGNAKVRVSYVKYKYGEGTVREVKTDQNYGEAHFIIIAFSWQHITFDWFSDYVRDIYRTLVETPRQELKQIMSELEDQVPDPIHTMHEKENAADAIKKYKERKEKETILCPPTCTGIKYHGNMLVH